MKLSNMRTMNGFTLAEVLITLGIIGVVAAMTMPTLMNSTQGAQYKAAYKKALSAIAQGVTLNVALEDWDFADTQVGNEDADFSIAKILTSRMNFVKISDSGFDTDYKIIGDSEDDGIVASAADNYTIYFNDGMVFSFPKDSAACTKTAPDPDDNNICLGIIDVNGNKGPNRVVACDGVDYNAGPEGCKVTNPTDIYPVQFYDSSVLPATNAAKAVLYGK